MSNNQQIVQACRDAIKEGIKLEMAAKKLPKDFPKGELIETTPSGKKWYAYCPHEVLKYYSKFPFLDVSLEKGKMMFYTM